jgi:hypothetical protein
MAGFVNHLHVRKLLLFNALSLADFVLTWRLVRQTDGQVYESNPVANAWLTTYGWIGLVVFKAAMVGLISILAVLIAWYRPRTSGRVLGFACLVTGLVVAYSCYLVRLTGGHADEPQAEAMTPAPPEFVSLGGDARRDRDYRILICRLSGDLIEGRLGLREAVDELTDRGGLAGAAWLETYRLRFPGHTDREYLAAHLVQFTLNSPRGTPTRAPDLAMRLDAQYQEAFGKPLPFSPDEVGERCQWVAAKRG